MRHELPQPAASTGRLVSAVRQLFRGVVRRWRCRRARLPWRQREAEAARQGCSAADTFFDLAGPGALLVRGDADTSGGARAVGGCIKAMPVTALRGHRAGGAVADPQTGKRSDPAGVRGLVHGMIDRELAILRPQLGMPYRAAAIDYAEIVARALGGREFVPCDQVASSLFDLAVELGALGREEQALAAYAELIARLADCPDPPRREQLARARDDKHTQLGLPGLRVTYGSVAEPGDRPWINIQPRTAGLGIPERQQAARAPVVAYTPQPSDRGEHADVIGSLKAIGAQPPRPATRM